MYSKNITKNKYVQLIIKNDIKSLLNHIITERYVVDICIWKDIDTEFEDLN